MRDTLITLAAVVVYLGHQALSEYRLRRLVRAIEHLAAVWQGAEPPPRH